MILFSSLVLSFEKSLSVCLAGEKVWGNDSEKIEIQVNFSFENLELSMLVIEVLWFVYVYRI